VTAEHTYEAFTNSLGSKFQVTVDPDRTVELKLTEVSERKLYPGQEEFAITFKGPGDAFLGQGIRLFNHEVMGSFDLFVVPIRQDAEGFYYEAVFNRFREESR
jgi:hypothetical protein